MHDLTEATTRQYLATDGNGARGCHKDDDLADFAGVNDALG